MVFSDQKLTSFQKVASAVSFRRVASAEMLGVMLAWPCPALLRAHPGSSARRRLSTSLVSMCEDPGYAMLGVQPGASRAELKAAYRERVKKHHPDVNPTDAAAREFRMLTEVRELRHLLTLRNAVHALPFTLSNDCAGIRAAGQQ